MPDRALRNHSMSASRIPPPRERLLAAADVLMYQRGYEAVGVAELCTAAGARKGSFYHFFNSKQALAVEMLEQAWTRTRETIFAAAFDDERRRAVASFTRYGRLLAKHQRGFVERDGLVPGCRFGNFAAELSGANEDVRACVHRVFEDMTAVFQSTIERGQVRGEVGSAVNPRKVALHVLAHMEGLMIVAKATRNPGVLEQLGPVVAQMLQP